jgi:hypothetical protein
MSTGGPLRHTCTWLTCLLLLVLVLALLLLLHT